MRVEAPGRPRPSLQQNCVASVVKASASFIMSQLNNILSAKSSTKPPGSNTCTSAGLSRKPPREPAQRSYVVLYPISRRLCGHQPVSWVPRGTTPRRWRGIAAIAQAPTRARRVDGGGAQYSSPLRFAKCALDSDRRRSAGPPHVRDATRADRRAEDRITAGKRVASVRRASRRVCVACVAAVLQEASRWQRFLLPTGVAFFQLLPPPRRRRDRHGTRC